MFDLEVTITKRGHDSYVVATNYGNAVLAVLNEKQFRDMLGALERMEHQEIGAVYMFPKIPASDPVIKG